MCGLQIVISMITAQIVFALFWRKMRIINIFLRVERSSGVIWANCVESKNRQLAIFQDFYLKVALNIGMGVTKALI